MVSYIGEGEEGWRGAVMGAWARARLDWGEEGRGSGWARGCGVLRLAWEGVEGSGGDVGGVGRAGWVGGGSNDNNAE